MSSFLKAHLEASFRDIKANQRAARFTAGFSHKMAELKNIIFVMIYIYCAACRI